MCLKLLVSSEILHRESDTENPHVQNVFGGTSTQPFLVPKILKRLSAARVAARKLIRARIKSIGNHCADGRSVSQPAFDHSASQGAPQ